MYTMPTGMQLRTPKLVDTSMHDGKVCLFPCLQCCCTTVLSCEDGDKQEAMCLGWA